MANVSVQLGSPDSNAFNAGNKGKQLGALSEDYMMKRTADLEIARAETLTNYEVNDAPLNEMEESGTAELQGVDTIRFGSGAQSAQSAVSAPSTVVNTPNSPRKQVLYIHTPSGYSTRNNT